MVDSVKVSWKKIYPDDLCSIVAIMQATAQRLRCRRKATISQKLLWLASLTFKRLLGYVSVHLRSVLTWPYEGPGSNVSWVFWKWYSHHIELRRPILGGIPAGRFERAVVVKSTGWPSQIFGSTSSFFVTVILHRMLDLRKFWGGKCVV